jgi:hypothetical protein
MPKGFVYIYFWMKIYKIQNSLTPGLHESAEISRKLLMLKRENN